MHHVYNFILTKFLMDDLSMRVDSIDEVIDSSSSCSHPHLVYPNGDYEIEINQITSAHWSRILDDRRLNAFVMQDIGYFFDLPCFRTKDTLRHYRIKSTSKHIKKVTHKFVGLSPNISNREIYTDPPLPDFCVNILFLDSIMETTLLALADALASWFSLFNSARPSYHKLYKPSPKQRQAGDATSPPSLAVNGRRACFIFDASPIKQRLINILIVSILDLAYTTQKITSIIINDIDRLQSYGFADLNLPFTDTIVFDTSCQPGLL